MTVAVFPQSNCHFNILQKASSICKRLDFSYMKCAECLIMKSLILGFGITKSADFIDTNSSFFALKYYTRFVY